MATKNFEKLTTKKLNALLNSASDEEKALIQAELDKRSEAQAAANSAEEAQYNSNGKGHYEMEASELSPEEQAIVDAAEAEEKAGKATSKKTHLSMTPEEIEARKAEMTENVGHVVKVMPNGEVEWMEGYISGVQHDKRSNALMYIVKVDGKTVRKAYGAKSLIVTEEVKEIVKAEKKVRTSKATGEVKAKRTYEEAEELRESAKPNVGRYAMLPVGEEKIKVYANGIMLDKRSNAVLFAFKNEEGKTLYKAVDNQTIEWLDEWNEKKRESVSAPKTALNPKQKHEDLAAKLAKAEEAAAKAQAKVEELKALYEASKTACEEWLTTDEGKAFVEAEATAETTEEAADPME
jgi:hypothetical protein